MSWHLRGTGAPPPSPLPKHLGEHAGERGRAGRRWSAAGSRTVPLRAPHDAIQHRFDEVIREHEFLALDCGDETRRARARGPSAALFFAAGYVLRRLTVTRRAPRGLLKMRGELTIAARSGFANGTLMTSMRNSAEFGSLSGAAFNAPREARRPDARRTIPRCRRTRSPCHSDRRVRYACAILGRSGRCRCISAS